MGKKHLDGSRPDLVLDLANIYLGKGNALKNLEEFGKSLVWFDMAMHLITPNDDFRKNPGFLFFYCKLVLSRIEVMERLNRKQEALVFARKSIDDLEEDTKRVHLDELNQMLSQIKGTIRDLED